jgi:hypothetical protein
MAMRWAHPADFTLPPLINTVNGERATSRDNETVPLSMLPAAPPTGVALTATSYVAPVESVHSGNTSSFPPFRTTAPAGWLPVTQVVPTCEMGWIRHG